MPNPTMFGLDFIQQGLPRVAYKSTTAKPIDLFFTKHLFNGPVLSGNESQDGIVFDYRKYGVAITEEAVRGVDPTRVNYKSNFNSTYLVPNFYHRVEEVTIADSDNRVFGEEISDNSNSQRRVMTTFSEKRDAMADSLDMTIEKMCAEALLTGRVTNKSGVQTFPMKASLLNQNGAKLISDPLATIQKAFINTRKENASARFNAIIMNPDDALNFVTANEKLLDKQTFDIARISFGDIADGAQAVGTMLTPAGRLVIYAYYGAYVDADGAWHNYVPQGSAILCGGAVGSMGYGRLQAFENNRPCYKVQKDRYVPIIKGEGDMRHYALEHQSAPLSVITDIDGYCVLTGIPAVSA